jgi:hypothetical protein
MKGKESSREVVKASPELHLDLLDLDPLGAILEPLNTGNCGTQQGCGCQSGGCGGGPACGCC